MKARNSSETGGKTGQTWRSAYEWKAFRGAASPLLQRYGLPTLLVAASMAASSLLRPYDFHTPLLLLSIVICALMGGTGPAFIAAVLSTVAIILFPGTPEFQEDSLQTITDMVLFLITGFLMGSWSDRRTLAEGILRATRDELETKLRLRTADVAQMSDTLQKEKIERERIENAIRTNLSRLTSAVAAANLGLWEWDLDSGDVTSMGHFDKILGLARGEFDGTLSSVESHVHPDDVSAWKEILKSAADEKKEFTHEHRVVWPDRSIHWVAGTGSFRTRENGGPSAMFGVLTDITDRKIAEQKLRENERLLQQVLATLPVGVQVIDREGNIILANDASKASLGDSITSGRGRTERSVACQHGTGKRIEADEWGFRRACLKGETITHEVVDIDVPEGDPRTIEYSCVPLYDMSGNGTGAVIVSVDVTERQRTEGALRESESKLKQAEELASIGYWERDLSTGRITGSMGTDRILGLASRVDPLTQADLQKLIHPDDREIQERALNDAVCGIRPYEVEYRIVRPDGEVRYIHLNDRVEYDASHHPIRFFGTMQDITERKLAEEKDRQRSMWEQTLAAVSNALIECPPSVQAKLQAIARQMATFMDDGCMIWLLSSDRTHYRAVAVHDADPNIMQLLESAQNEITLAPVGSGWHERIIRTGNGLLLPRVTAEQLTEAPHDAIRSMIKRAGVKSILAVPLRHEGNVIGTLTLFRTKYDHPYTEDDQVLLQEVADRTALITQNAQLFEQSESDRKRLEALSRRLLNAQETERRALARELHDELGQQLTAIKFGLERLNIEIQNSRSRSTLKDLSASVDRLLQQIRSLSLDLRPSMLDEFGLMSALRWFIGRQAQLGSLKWCVKGKIGDERFLPEIETAFFRVAQEAMTNVLKHAHATAVDVVLARNEGNLHLNFKDNGSGFEVSAAQIAAWQSKSLGIIGMQERMQALGGFLEIASKPGHGTQIQASAPLSSASPSAEP